MKNIIDYSLSEIAQKLKNKEFTSVEVVNACIKRIEETKDIKALIGFDKEVAIAQAKAADKKLAKNEKGLLLGVPIVIKDSICTTEYKTTCASKFLENFRPVYQATVIEKLKNEGAVILGKTNLDEFAMGGTGETSFFGNTLNPLDKTRVAGGSSSGSAASVASKQSFAALGSDTGGSIRQPAAFCGLVGLKPTYGRVSRYGLVAFASSFDQIGPITRTVKDSALLLDAISGYDEMDGTSIQRTEEKPFADIEKDIKHLTIGVAPEFFSEKIDSEITDRIKQTIEFFKSSGAKVVDITLPNIDKALADYYVLSSAEAASNLARFDGIKYGFRAEDFSGLEDLYYKSRTQGFGSEVKRRIILGNYVLSSGYYDAYYKKAQEVQELLKREYAEAFKKCDVVIAPTTPTTAFKFGEKSKPIEVYMSDLLTVSANIISHPAISFPVGLSKKTNMPIGCQLIGKMWGESDLFALANYYENNNKENN